MNEEQNDAHTRYPCIMQLTGGEIFSVKNGKVVSVQVSKFPNTNNNYISINEYINETCIKDNNKEIKCNELYHGFKVWCKEIGPNCIMSRNEFYVEIAKKYEMYERKGVKYIRGIDMIDDLI